jgi:hypothetical protein
MSKYGKFVNGWRLSNFIKCLKIMNLLLPLVSGKMGKAVSLLNAIKRGNGDRIIYSYIPYLNLKHPQFSEPIWRR